ncbi:MAG: glycoside hydrolase family 16 protein [Bacteroidales bacterium]|nr:glycoside hydrolase family 16 protein [Bacteroidales bacterium]
MRTTHTILAFLLLAAFGTAAQDSTKYKLVWEDDFNKPVLDETKWTIVVNGKGGGNRELQYYCRENISIEKEPASGSNCLVITAKKQNYRLHRATSGRLSTQNKMGFRYGKLEARIKLPKTANGLWPAFWMLGSNYPQAIWPKCGEIDIMEMGNKDGIAANTQERYFNGACHWGERFNHGKYPNYGKSTTNDASLQDSFHVYTLIWDKTSVRMYLDMDANPDARPYFQMPIDGEAVANKPAQYFHKPFFVIFNLAVGGNFSNIRNINKVSALKNGEAKMYVDYVRLYQQGSPDETLQND